MKSHEIRQSFLDYFAERGHKPQKSAPLVPHGDPTLLFTNAGMVPFKSFFLGDETPPAPRAVRPRSACECPASTTTWRTSDPARAITPSSRCWATSPSATISRRGHRDGLGAGDGGVGGRRRHLYATVFRDDDGAHALWLEDLRSAGGAGAALREKDNFWAMGDTGPCGPCSEIFVDLAPDEPAADWGEGSESGRYIEIWNLVFMQYDRAADGSLKPLPKPSVDTGAGLERVSAVLQGVASNYDTDLFRPILAAAATLAGTRYGADGDADTSLRVIADHLRAVAFSSPTAHPGQPGARLRAAPHPSNTSLPLTGTIVLLPYFLPA